MTNIQGRNGYIPISQPNAVDVAQTTVDTTATKIEMPDNATQVSLRHDGTSTIWVGQDSNITAGGTDVFPMEAGDIMILDITKGNDNAIYAIVASGSVTVYAIGEIVL